MLLIYGIMWGKELLDKGLGWRIGDGSRCNIWDDNWLPGSSNFKPFSHPPPNYSLSLVRDLLTLSASSWTWDEQKLSVFFLPTDIKQVNFSAKMCIQ